MKWIALFFLILLAITFALFMNPEEPTFSGVPTHFAEVIDGVVVRVIVADQAFIDSGKVGDPKNWVPTYPEGNYASKGYTYDKTKGRFISQKPNDSALFNDTTGEWTLNEVEIIHHENF